MSQLELSVILSTFERAGHLVRSLASLSCQHGVEGKFEVLVTDDGSRDDTAEVVARFARDAAFPVRFLTHPHAGFQLAACRNQGVRHAKAPYLLFSDGDCIFPPDHLRQHLAARRRGVVRAGDSVLLDREVSNGIDAAAIRSGACWRVIPRSARRRIGRLHRKALFYQATRHRTKPKLVGNNIGIWREQIERVNGFDQQYRGWGCEDDDLAARLRRAGYAIRSVLGHTHAYHLWHPPHATTPEKWSDGANVDYLHRPLALTRCMSGLVERKFRELTVEIAAAPEQRRFARKLAREFTGTAATPDLLLLLDTQQKAGDAATAVTSIHRAGKSPAAILASLEASLCGADTRQTAA